jgi:capsule polysaccharide export protein KpsE/RkpR
VWIGVVTFCIALFLPTTYRSTTLLMPPDDQSGSKANLAMMAGMASKVTGGGGGGELGMLAGDLLGTRSSGDLFIGVLRSRTAQDNLVKQFDLTTVYGTPWLHLRAPKEDARKRLEFNTEASQDRKSGMITISVVDRDPSRAAALTDAYVDQLNRLLASVSTSAAGRERQFLEQRLVEVKKNLDEETTALSQFSSNTTTFDPLEQGKATVAAVAALEGQLIAAESQLRGLQTIYMPDNVRVRSLQARVTELRKQLSALSGRPVIALPDSTDNTPADLPFPSLRQLPLLGATYIGLFRRVKIEETVYELLTQQYELAKVQEAKEIPVVRVLDRAEVPLRKWGPHRGMLTMIGAIVGLLLGSLFVLGRDRWKNWDPSEPRKIFISEAYAQVQAWKIVKGIKHALGRVSHSKNWQENGSS